MKTISISVLAVLFFSGCNSNDISTLSKNECRKQGFKYKTKKRFNYRSGKYDIQSICYKRA